MPDRTRKSKSRAQPSLGTRPETGARSADQHGYATLLGIKVRDTVSLHERVREGLSYLALEKLRRALDWPTQTVAEALQIPLRTLHRRKEEGRLRPDESDRLVRLTRLLARTIELFEGDTGAARTWLDTPLAALGGAAPLAMAQTEPGANEVAMLIGRLEHGVFT